MQNPYHNPIGNSSLSAWLVAPGVCWVQSRSPELSKQLARRSDARTVMRGVAGGHLKTFEFHHPLAWAEKLVTRLLKYGGANEPFSSLKRPETHFDFAGASSQRRDV